MNIQRFFRVDFINKQGLWGLATNKDKIVSNYNQIPEFREKIEQGNKKGSDFSIMTVFGRWIIIYQSNGRDDNDTIMQLIDFRINMMGNENEEVFSANTLKNIQNLQERYDKVFEEKNDTIELSYAEAFEQMIKPNFFACESDDLVLQKARDMGVLPAIGRDPGNGRIKVVLADEKTFCNDEPLTHIYAFMHFTGNDGGFAYLKIYDLMRNPGLIDDMQKGIEEAGGKFDRAYLMERFDTAKLN